VDGVVAFEQRCAEYIEAEGVLEEH
jgi:hypothetical protein